jgi:hypothetical protein
LLLSGERAVFQLYSGQEEVQQYIIMIIAYTIPAVFISFMAYSTSRNLENATPMPFI